MKTETMEEFLARGGKVQKSKKDSTLEELLYNEGLMDHQEAQSVSEILTTTLSNSLDENFKKKDQ
jgi:hypothetical protein